MLWACIHCRSQQVRDWSIHEWLASQVTQSRHLTFRHKIDLRVSSVMCIPCDNAYKPCENKFNGGVLIICTLLTFYQSFQITWQIIWNISCVITYSKTCQDAHRHNLFQKPWMHIGTNCFQIPPKLPLQLREPFLPTVSVLSSPHKQFAHHQTDKPFTMCQTWWIFCTS